MPGGIDGIRSREGGGGGRVPGSAPLEGSAALVITGADSPAYDGARGRGGGSGGMIAGEECTGGGTFDPTGGGGTV